MSHSLVALSTTEISIPLVALSTTETSHSIVALSNRDISLSLFALTTTEMSISLVVPSTTAIFFLLYSGGFGQVDDVTGFTHFAYLMQHSGFRILSVWQDIVLLGLDLCNVVFACNLILVSVDVILTLLATTKGLSSGFM